MEKFPPLPARRIEKPSSRYLRLGPCSQRAVQSMGLTIEVDYGCSPPLYFVSVEPQLSAIAPLPDQPFEELEPPGFYQHKIAYLVEDCRHSLHSLSWHNSELSNFPLTREQLAGLSQIRLELVPLVSKTQVLKNRIRLLVSGSRPTS
jgi:hypothetical protein